MVPTGRVTHRAQQSDRSLPRCAFTDRQPLLCRNRIALTARPRRSRLQQWQTGVLIFIVFITIWTAAAAFSRAYGETPTEADLLAGAKIIDVGRDYAM